MEHDNIKHIIDAISLGGVAMTLAGWLPAVAALFSIIWTIIRILETKTVRRLLGHND